jgi:hypothetical protein
MGDIDLKRSEDYGIPRGYPCVGEFDQIVLVFGSLGMETTGSIDARARLPWAVLPAWTERAEKSQKMQPGGTPHLGTGDLLDAIDG